MLESLQGTLGSTLPSILGALVILAVGWLVALVVRAGVRKVLGLARVDERLRTTTGHALSVETGVATGLYYLILLVVLVAFFNVLKLEQVSGSLQTLVDQVLAYAPKLVAGGVLLLVAWILATVLRAVCTKALGATGLDEKLSSAAGARPMSRTLGGVAFWLVLLMFLPGVFDALELQGLTAPVQGMVDEALAMLPNVISALAIGLVGWFLARILREVVTNVLAATGLDAAGRRAGLSGTTTLSGLIGLVVYVLVFVPALIAALDTLAIEAISAPATEMLAALMAAVPNLFAAAIILAAAWLVSSFVSTVVVALLGGLGFDRVPAKLGLKQAFQGATTPSQLVGKVVVFFVMLFAVVEAASRLGFSQVSGLVSTFTAFGGQVLLGVAIIAIGFWLSNLAHAALGRLSEKPSPVAGLVRFAILGLVLAMGLRAMGLADDIVNLAFGLTLGAVAVAVALSFGLGGREAAGRQMEHWFGRLRGDVPGEVRPAKRMSSPR